MGKFTVVYDACVLYPAPLRDLLLQLATADLFRAKWTAKIHEEWIGSLLKDRQDLAPEQLDRTRQLIDRAVPDCLVENYEFLIASIELPDPDDRHVAAAAIHARADAIVTLNLKDFPEAALKAFNLEAIHPDEFLTYQIDLNEAAVLVAVQECLKRLKNPPRTVDQYLATLQSLGLPKTVALLRPYRTILGAS